MNISGKRVILNVLVSLAPAICGLAGFVSPVSAQTAAVAAAMPSASALAAADLQRRVQTALHDDPYLYDKHVTVSAEQGAVVLHGFVLSSFDLLDALRIARKAAGDNRVIDNLSIELNGQSGRY